MGGGHVRISLVASIALALVSLGGGAAQAETGGGPELAFLSERYGSSAVMLAGASGIPRSHAASMARRSGSETAGGSRSPSLTTGR